jgi:hypothetical protein
MAYGPPTTLDPTNVMGRRIAAWFIDLIPALILGAIVAGRGMTRYDNVSSDFCTQYRLTHASSFCFNTTGSTAYASTTFRGGAFLVSLVYWFAVAGLLQGATGASIGKHIVGLRVVDANGNICGIGRALLRTFVGVFEIGFCFLIGLITALVTHPHRRVGDFAAGTFVVAKQSVGTPIAAAMGVSAYPPPWTPPTWGPPAAGGPTPYGTPAQGWGGSPVPTQAPTAAPPTASPPTWGTPGATPPPAQAPTGWGVPAVSPPLGADQPETAASQQAGWAAPSPTPAPAPAPAPQPAAPAPREPQWDAQRNAWVFWEAETNRWLQHDPTAGQWGPLR